MSIDTAMVYDPYFDQTVLLCGKVSDVATKECWIWREGAWATCDMRDTMEARYGHAMTWDATGGRVVLVGGRDADGDDLPETWEYLGGNWYRTILSSDSAAARTGASLAYDPDREAVVMFGGRGANGLENGVWKLDTGGMWTNISPTAPPQPVARELQTMTYLASRTANRPDSGSTEMGKGTWSNRYDARGNRIADAEFEYQYNAADRLVAIFDRETQQELMRSVYDGTGKRVNVSEPGGPSMWTMYDGEVPIIERSDDGSIALHVYADGLHIARLTMSGSKDAADDPPDVHYYHSDHLGSPRLMTDQAGDVAWPDGKGASYWAYGGVMEDLAGDTEANRWRFTGKPEDETTGHHYFNARYLSESTKYNAPQFMSPDPVLGNVGDPRSWNRYAYCAGNPVNFIDLNGMWDDRIHLGAVLNGTSGYGGTVQWALDLGFEEDLAWIIARANQGIDSSLLTGPLPGQDPSRHFNTNRFASWNSPEDSRRIHAETHLQEAIKLERQAQRNEHFGYLQRMHARGLREQALQHLGMGLHSIQDIHAHRDEYVRVMINANGEIIYSDHLGDMDADNPGEVSEPNMRYYETKKDTYNYIERFITATRFRFKAD